jgi:hypothetical protein
LEEGEALAEFAGEGFEVGGADVTDGAAEEFLFQAGETTGEVGDFLGGGGGNFVPDGLTRCGGLGGDLEFGLAVPFDEGGFGDTEAAGDAGKAEALDAEAEKLGSSGQSMHFRFMTSILIGTLMRANRG